jgi:hypothetical protein
MTDRTNVSIASLLATPATHAVQFSQGIIRQWDRTELRNQIEWRGITLTDVPMVEGINALALKEGDIVGMFGWAPEHAKGVGSWWILGKLSNPGEFIADLTFYLGQVRFLTADDGFLQMYIGNDTNGIPLTRIYYGDETETPALSVSGTNSIRIRDPADYIIFENDALTGVGLARPYLHYHLVATINAVIEGTVLIPSTRSAALVNLYTGNPTVWHPTISYDINIGSTGTPGWRITVNGTVVFTGTVSASGTFNIPGWGTAITPGQVVTINIQAQNTGAGFTRLSILRFEGRQS